MATDSEARATSRPRPWLLIALGVLVVFYLLTRIFSGGGAPAAVSSGGARPGGKPQAAAQIDPAQLDVKIESLVQPGTKPATGDRNPFRFQPRAAPPPPPGPPPVRAPQVTAVQPDPTDTGPSGPPPPPPIGNAIKYLGVMETTREKIAAFTDCKATFPGKEGDVIEGRYRVVRIQIESAVLEYVDGRGRATLPLNGQQQACVGK